jgi:hypothetical protein
MSLLEKKKPARNEGHLANEGLKKGLVRLFSGKTANFFLLLIGKR